VRIELSLQSLLFWVCGTAVTACGSSEGNQQPSNLSPSNSSATTNAPAPSTPSASPSSAQGAASATPSASSAAASASQPAPPPSQPAPPSTNAPSSSAEATSTPPAPGNSAPSSSGNCTPGSWPAADPAAAGPYSVVTENEVGPEAGVDDEGNPTAFTLFRPSDIESSDQCHPVITWGNGTGAYPALYKTLLGHLASHGFVVIASDNPNVGQGDPAPMLVGVTWVLEQNEDPASPLYQHIDVAHIGATGHSQGGFATSSAGGDPRVTAIAPLCGASSQRNLHGPALLLCGGADEVVSCDSIQRSFDGISTQPAMLASYLTADHGNWITFRGTTPSPMETAVTAWMRVHLMNDTELRSWFYGADCKLCTDAAWGVQQKSLDN
jgi:Chlorophyllase enzyme